ncbi:MAG: hypothetical protein ABI321_02885 [Polyangia bacterium]
MPGAPSFEKTTKLVGRALGMKPDELRAGFRAATRAHLPQILEIRRKILGERLAWDDERYLAWRYDFDGAGHSRGTCFVVVRNERVLGLVGAEHVRLTYDRDLVPSLLIMDIAVDPAIDGSGLGIWMDLALFDAHPVVLAIGANPNSVGLVEKLFHALPHRTHYVTPVRFTRFFQKRLGRERLATMLALPANVVVRAWRKLTRLRDRGLVLRKLTRFDASVEALFSRRAAPDEITFERTAATLNWRLFGNPRARYEVVGAYDGDTLVGYIASHRTARRDALREVGIADWLIDARHPKAFEALVLDVLRRAVRADMDLVHATPLLARSGPTLRRLGFRATKRTYNLVGVRVQEPERWPRLLDGAAWYLNEANTDRDGMA